MKTFLDTMGFTPDENCLMVVDALNLCFRYKHSGTETFADEFISTIKSLAKSYKAGKIIIAADWGSSKYRREIYPEYKGNRSDKYKDQTEEEKEAFALFLEEYERAVKEARKHFIVCRYQRIEADDIAGYICNNLKNTQKVWLISTDKDWDLLVNEKVSRFSYVTRKETTLETWSERYSVERGNFLLYKILMGDAGDNIKGIEGIGDKRASTLANEYKTLEELLLKLPTIKATSKYMTNLKAGTELLKLNKLLMDLSLDNIRDTVTEDDKSAKQELDAIMENLWL